MHWLSTAFQLVLLLAGLGATWICVEEARSCNSLRRKLYDGLADLDRVDDSFRKLRGYVYGKLQHEPSARLPILQNELVKPTTEQCENWATAQRDGPTSAAARCECQYCEGKRAERRQLRSAVIPKTARAQGELAKLNSEK